MTISQNLKFAVNLAKALALILTFANVNLASADHFCRKKLKDGTDSIVVIDGTLLRNCPKGYKWVSKVNLLNSAVVKNLTQTQINEIIPTILNTINTNATKGDKGDKGDIGATGAQGLAGAKGDSGPKGDNGTSGEKGERGNDGNPGLQGPVGEAGLRGLTGDTGPQGPAGARGEGDAPLKIVLTPEEGQQFFCSRVDILPLCADADGCIIRVVVNDTVFPYPVAYDALVSINSTPTSGSGSAAKFGITLNVDGKLITGLLGEGALQTLWAPVVDVVAMTTQTPDFCPPTSGSSQYNVTFISERRYHGSEITIYDN